MIYIHIPFCKSFCTYCDFYSEQTFKSSSLFEEDSRLFEKFTTNLLVEIKDRKEEILKTKEIKTLYIGGGTPSVLPLCCISKLVKALDFIDFEEFTIEVNPEDIVDKGLSYVKDLKSLGVNRVSMGVQSFDDKILKWMNRRHNAGRAIEAFNILRKAGIDNISIDLIFGISHLSDESWQYSIEKAIELEPEHISAYQLSIEENSTLGRMLHCGKYHEADENMCVENYCLLTEILSEHGYIHYEISNFAKPGFEAIHNSAYWYRVPYVGLGPAAHSFDGKNRKWNTKSILNYVSEEEKLTEEDIKIERLMLGLRTAKGLPYDFLYSNFDLSILNRLINEGKMQVLADNNVRIAEQYFFISDSIIETLL